MSYTKTQIYNLALSALLLNKKVDNADTDTSNEARQFNKVWDTVLHSTLQDLDLDSLSSFKTLELIEEIDRDTYLWSFAYKYPSDCAFFRRLKSSARIDTKQSHLPKSVTIYNGRKVIMTDEPNAVAHYIPTDVGLEFFSAPAAQALSYALASISAPLLVGKGSKSLKESIERDYLIYKLKAQELDAMENFNYEDDWERSELVQVRLS